MTWNSKINRGFETETKLEFLGIGKKRREQKDWEKVRNHMNEKYPAPTSCSDAKDKIKRLQQSLITDFVNESSDNKWLIYTNELITKFSAYINANCTEVADPFKDQPTIVQPTSVTSGTGTAGATMTTAQTPFQMINSGGSNSINEASAQNGKKKIPAWAWYAGGGLLLTIAAIIYFKNK